MVISQYVIVHLQSRKWHGSVTFKESGLQGSFRHEFQPGRHSWTLKRRWVFLSVSFSALNDTWLRSEFFLQPTGLSQCRTIKPPQSEPKFPGISTINYSSTLEHVDRWEVCSAVEICFLIPDSSVMNGNHLCVHWDINQGGSVRQCKNLSPTESVLGVQVAIIIPFRHRENHLKYWLHYLHPILRRQRIDYGIYIINQVGRPQVICK